MRNILVAAALACAALTAGCTIQNPFGGPALTLTGDFTADEPAIKAYAASIKAGVVADEAKIKAQFQKLCPAIPAVQQVLISTDVIAGAQQLLGATAGTTTVADANSALEIGNDFCGGALAGDLKTAFLQVVQGVEDAEALIKSVRGN